MGVAADVMARDSQTSTRYWEIVQDALADLVRIMLVRCYDEKNYPQLFAPAEWKFPRPYFLEPYANCVSAGAYIMVLHMCQFSFV